MKPLNYKYHEKIEQILEKGLQDLPMEIPIYSVKMIGKYGLWEYGSENE